VKCLNGAKTSSLFLLSDELTEFGDGISVAGRSTGGGEAFQERCALRASRLGLGILVETAGETESLQGIRFGERDSAKLCSFGGTVNGMCVDGVTTNALKAELVIGQAVASGSKVGGPRDVAGTDFPALVFRGEHGGGVLMVDHFKGVNLCRREGAIHLGEQGVGLLKKVGSVTALE
jgi:hypothetical protein